MIKLFSFLILITSCAQVELVNINSKHVKRIDKSSEDRRPNYYVLDFDPSKAQRKIASVENENDKFSNKQVYFFTLLQQYKTLNSIINISDKELSCPKFHNDLLSYGPMISVQKSSYSLDHNYSQVLSNEKLLATYPIMALPYQKQADVYSYYKTHQKNLSSVIVQAISDYNNKNFVELKELCEKGSSDGYYIYENFVNIYGPNINHNEVKLEAILNIPVFSNMLLLDSFKVSQFEGINIFNDKVLNRSNLGWFKNYLYELRKIRNNESKLSTYRSSFDEELSQISNYSYTR